MTIRWKAVEQCFAVLENVSVLDLALSGVIVKPLTCNK